MNRNDFRNPLIRSGILLLIVFLFISIVASSPADGFIGSILALVSGLFKGLLFIIALAIGLIFSIAVLILIFLGAVSLHSTDQAKTIFEQLKTALTALYCTMRCCGNDSECTPATSTETTMERLAETEPDLTDGQIDDYQTEPNLSAVPAMPAVSAVNQTVLIGLESQIEELSEQLIRVQSSLKISEERLLSLENRFTAGLESATDLADKLSEIKASTQDVIQSVQSHTTEIGSVTEAFSTLEKDLNPKIDSITEEINALKKKTSVPEVVTGILSYIDDPADRDSLTEKAGEAVSRGMTYAQTDEFFRKALPAKVYKALNDHPRLTKDFIRSVKKKFE